MEGLAELNARPADALTRDLLACCDVPRWAAAVRDGRPYPSAVALLAAADAAARALTTEEVDRALAAHPRIGERADGEGAEGEGAEGEDMASRWSRTEQSGVQRDEDTLAALEEANRAYEDRFGRVFLICAAGLSSEQILAALRARLANDDESEAAVVADELRQIALLRLRGLVSATEGSRP